MASVLVILGTNGTKDWIQLPDGQRFNLGPLSVLSFVSKLAKNSRVAKQTLDRYLKEGEAMLSVDADKMWSLMVPRRAVWATDSFMPSDQRHSPFSIGTSVMATIYEDLTQVERVVAHLNKKASVGETDPKALEYLIQAAQKIKSPDQSKNATYYGLGQSDTQSTEAPTPHVVRQASNRLSFDVYQSNLELARDINKKAEETVNTIEAKVAAGRKFNASKAKADVRAIAVKTAGICEQTQLVEGWVQSDLKKLAAEMDHIHGLFHPTKD